MRRIEKANKFELVEYKNVRHCHSTRVQCARCQSCQTCQSPTECPLSGVKRTSPRLVTPRCTAKSKRTGKRCRTPAVRGWRVCRMHGARGGAPKANGTEITTRRRSMETIELWKRISLKVGKQRSTKPGTTILKQATSRILRRIRRICLSAF